MSDVVLTNARVFTGTGDDVIPNGAVWVSGAHVRRVGSADVMTDVPADVGRVDLGGRFVMPGMTESHAHISYADNGPTELDRTPVEEAMLASVDNARLMLGSGFTSAISFGSVHRIDVFLRNAIDRGRIPGPRLAASGRDIGATGSNADFHKEWFKPQLDGLGMIVNGPWEVRKAVRLIRKNGADVVKIFLDGEALSDHSPPGELTYTDEEVDAAVHEAHPATCAWCATPARPSPSSRRCGPASTSSATPTTSTTRPSTCCARSVTASSWGRASRGR